MTARAYCAAAAVTSSTLSAPFAVDRGEFDGAFARDSPAPNYRRRRACLSIEPPLSRSRFGSFISDAAKERLVVRFASLRQLNRRAVRENEF